MKAKIGDEIRLADPGCTCKSCNESGIVSRIDTLNNDYICTNGKRFDMDEDLEIIDHSWRARLG